MDLDRAIADADLRIQERINAKHERMQIARRFAFEHARRSEGQRWRWIFVKYGLKAEQEKS